MCSGPSVDNTAQQQAQQEAAQARAAEEARQARITQGREAINRLFDKGETATTTKASVVTPEWAAWNERNQAFKANPGQEVSYGDDSGTTTAWQGTPAPGAEPTHFQDQDQTVWNKTGTAFDDKFYAGQRQAVLNYYQPELQRQFDEARRGMEFALARAGITKSTEAGRQVGLLDSQFQVSSADVASKAENAAADMRRQVEDQRSALLSQLESTSDASGAANAALARSQQLNQTKVAYSPLGDIFAGIGSTVGAGIAGARDAALTTAIRGAATPSNPRAVSNGRVVGG